MTTIAARDGKMAADSLEIIKPGYKLYEAEPKIQRLGSALFGSAGMAISWWRVKKWILSGADPEKKPSIQPKDGFYCIRMDADGKIYDTDYSLIWCESDPKRGYFAIGSGREFALGAMYIGASAKEAVEAATSMDMYTGGATQVESV